MLKSVELFFENFKSNMRMIKGKYSLRALYEVEPGQFIILTKEWNFVDGRTEDPFYLLTVDEMIEFKEIIRPSRL